MIGIFRRKGFYVFCALALFSFALILINREAIAYYVLSKAAHHYAARENITLATGRIRGNPLSKTTVQHLSLRPGAGQPRVYDFKAESLTCTYNIWDLQQGFARFLQGLDCTAESPEFSYDLSGLESQQQSESQPELFTIPAAVPRLAVNKGRVILRDSGWRAEAGDISSRLAPEASVPELHFKAGRVLFEQEGITRIDTEMSMFLRYVDAKLFVESLVFGDKPVTVTGAVNLAGIAEKHVEFTSELFFAENRLHVSGTLDNGLLQARAATDSFDIGEIQRRLGGSGWDISGNISGESDFTYNFTSKTDLAGSFAFAARNGKAHGVQLQAASIAGKFDSQSLRISSAGLRLPDNVISINDASVPMTRLQSGNALTILDGISAEFEAAINDHASLLQLFRLDWETVPESFRPDALTVNGRFEEGTVYLEHLHAVTPDSSLTIKKGVIPIPVTAEKFSSVPLSLAASFNSSSKTIIAGLSDEFLVDGRIDADVTVAGSLKELRGAVSVTGENLAYNERHMGALSLQGEFRASQEKPGIIKSFHFTASEMTLENESGVMALFSPAKASLQDRGFSLEAALQFGGQGRVVIETSRTGAKGLRGKITTHNLDSEGWLASYINKNYFFSDADIEMFFSGSAPDLQVQITGSLGAAGQRGAPFPMAGEFALDYSSRGIAVKDFRWKSPENNRLDIKGFLPYDPLAETPFLDGQMSLDGNIDLPALEDIGLFLEPLGIKGDALSLDVALTGTWRQPSGRMLLKADNIEPPDILKQYSDAPYNATWDFSATHDSIELHAAVLASKDFTAHASGSWQHGFSVKELLQRRITELQGEVAADVVVDLNNMNFLRKKFAWMRRLDGRTQAKLSIAGPVSGPDIRGSFFMQNGELSHVFKLPTLSAINLQGEFDKRSLTIASMQGEVGGSPVKLKGRLSFGRQGEIDVRLEADGENVLLYRSNDLRMRGDIHLQASGPMESLAISGSTSLTGGYYTKSINFLERIGAASAPAAKDGDFLFSFKEQPLNNAALDIKITTIEPFRIRNNLIRGTLRPELVLKGTGELPFLVGTVYIDPSRVLLPTGRLQVQSGLIRFLEGDPDRPQIDILASSKVLDYDINVVTQGPIDDPVITLSSSPALPSDDLLLLLLTGQPPKQDVALGAQDRSSTNLMVYLGRDFLNKWLEEDAAPGEESILDRFELDYGRGVTRSGEQTIESTFRLSELNNDKKRVYYLSAEKDRYDAFNYGLKVVFRFE